VLFLLVVAFSVCMGDTHALLLLAVSQSLLQQQGRCLPSWRATLGIAQSCMPRPISFSFFLFFYFSFSGSLFLRPILTGSYCSSCRLAVEQFHNFDVDAPARDQSIFGVFFWNIQTQFLTIQPIKQTKWTAEEQAKEEDGSMVSSLQSSPLFAKTIMPIPL